MSREISRLPREASIAKLIEGFRKELGLNQEALAKALGIKRLAILMWEKEGKGGYEPSAESRIRLARLAQHAISHEPAKAELLRSYARRFWELVGVDDSALRILVPGLEDSFKRYEKRLREAPASDDRSSVLLPVIEENFDNWDHESLMSRIHAQIRDGVKTYVPFPSFQIPRPRATVCIVAQDAYMRPLFNPGDPVAVDISTSGIITASYAKKSFEKFGASMVGQLPIVAAYYNRPENPPRWRGGGGLKIRTATFTDEGRIHLSTEVGTDIMHVAMRLAAMREVDRKELQKVMFGGMVSAELKGPAKQDLDEMSDLIIPDDPGVSVIGKVVAWIGSSWTREVERALRKE